MFKKILIIMTLVFISRISIAVTIDLPGYDFADIARSANLNPAGSGVYNFNFMSASEDITDAYATTYIYSDSANATINLDFAADVYNADGFDISVFFVGGGAQGHAFGLSLVDNPGTYPAVINFDSNNYPNYEHTGFNLSGNGFSIFRMDIDLDQYGSLGSSPIGTLSFDVSHGSAAPSLVGAYHLQPAAVVPIPLPIILFTSGLALLGFVGRKSR